MNKIVEVFFAIFNLLGRLHLDIEKMPDGKVKICFIVDPDDLK